MSCVTKTIVLSSSRWSRMISVCSSARTIGSTAPNGSSMSRMLGSAARPRATPDALLLTAGQLIRVAGREGAIEPDGRPSARGRARAASFGTLFRSGHGRDVVDHLAVRQQPGVLHHVADATAQMRRARPRDVSRRSRIVPAVGSTMRLIMRSRVVLPEPLRPDEHRDLACRDDQIELVDGDGAIRDTASRRSGTRSLRRPPSRRPRSRARPERMLFRVTP